MRHFLGVSVLVAFALVIAGCGGSSGRVQRSAGSLRGTYVPPRWVSNIVGREVRLFGGRHVTGGSYHLPKTGEADIRVWGSFTHPPWHGCPAAVRCANVHGTTLLLEISARTHRLVSARLSQEITPTQAPAIARRSNRLFSIFPSIPGHAKCSIPRGGVQLRGAAGIPARCTTMFTAYRPPRSVIHIRFGERWYVGGHRHIAAWIVGVRLRDGHVQRKYDVIGEPPQLWK